MLRKLRRRPVIFYSFVMLLALFGLPDFTKGPLFAAPFPAGTTLTIKPGVCSGSTLIEGSAFSIGAAIASDACVVPGSTGEVLAPGMSGGIVIDKNQASGGQELASSASNTTPSEIDAAWFYFGNYGTHFTPAGATNLFDSASCAGSACAGKTALNSWNVAWNESLSPNGIPIGGGVVDSWTVSGTNYSLDYRQSICSGYLCYWEPATYVLHLEGEIILPDAPSFLISLSPASNMVSLQYGGRAEWQVDVVPVLGFSSPVTLSKHATSACAELLSFLSSEVSPGSGTTMFAQATMIHPACTMVVEGFSGGIIKTGMTWLAVATNTPLPTNTPTPTQTPIPTPTGHAVVYITPTAETVLAGQTATYTVSISPCTNGAGGYVTLMCSSSTCPETCSFSPNPVGIGGSSTSTLTLATSAPHAACSFTVGTAFPLTPPCNIIPTSASLTVTTATPTPAETPTPTPTPASTCEQQWPVTHITTFGNGGTPLNNAKVSHRIIGNIVDPASYGPTASRIVLCRDTRVTAMIHDTTGTPTNTALTPGIVCTSSGCSVASLTRRERYQSVSADGTDTDRITLVAQ